MLRPLVRIPNIQTKKGVNTREKLGPYQLEKKTINELLEAFGHVYPYLNQELEDFELIYPQESMPFNHRRWEFLVVFRLLTNLVRNSQVR